MVEKLKRNQKMAKINEKLQHDVEIAIDSYGDSNNLDIFKQFVGKISGMEPYGEPELGKAINEGDWETLRSLLFKLTNFDDTPVNPDEQELWDIDAKAAEDAVNNKDKLERKREYLNKQIKTAEKHGKDGPLGKKGSMDAKRDEYKFKKELQSLSTEADDKYNKEKLDNTKEFREPEEDKNSQTTITTETTQETKGFSEKEDSMEISKKDLNKIMAAMRTINKHFAEEQVAEDQNEEVESQVEDTAEEEGSDESKQLTVVELPDDVADAIRDALDKATEVEADTDGDEDDGDEENFSEEDDVEEEEEEEDFCGDGEECFSDNEELMEFSEAITDTIENLNKKTNKLAAKLEEDATKFVTEFSMKEFKTFAESVTATLEAISSRVDALADKVSKNEITKNLDNLKKTGDDMEEKFITKADEKPVAAAVDTAIVQNPEATPAQFSESTSEDDTRRAAIKEFFSQQ